ncbi:MAG TPA: NADH-specific enoyl-ACP reductase [Candidatus Latescibacteria bacterium]|nr:NADH-specific enoyl-ACP reductase [Candidatus Latescibacterota bacterium]|tara:strand:- start:2919 stop:3686 length:768 start_codon:yes stop_codon:yes gene_type:complete
MIMQDKTGFVAGVANRRSIAWAVAKALDREGTRLALGYLGERELEAIEPLLEQLQNPPLLVQCDATNQDSVGAAFDKAGAELGHLDCLVHAIAFANRDDLVGRFADTSIDGYQLALGVSAYTLNSLARAAEPLMTEGGGIVALTYLGSERVIRNYNVMGVAKAALESGVRYLASEFGESNIRVNALSAGPIRTLAARGIGGLNDMLRIHAERAALKRNNTVDEVGDAALFLCSPLSRGITGEVIYCDAGYRIMGL